LSEFPTREIGGVIIVEAEGRLDALVATPFGETLRQALERQARVVVDMAHVTYISSSCLRVLLMGVRLARREGGDLKLCCLSPRVRQIFALAGFDLVFQLCETRAKALASFAPAGGPEHLCASA